MKFLITTLVLFAVWAAKVQVRGHGRLLLPPSRSSLWRYKDDDPLLIPHKDIIVPNYTDAGLNCGGRQTQIDNDGKCGVCGDPYNGVRANEAGGKYALGIITRYFDQGQIIDARVEITAQHKGYFEFRLCPWNNLNTPITQECLDQYLLQFDDGQTKWYLPENAADANGMHDLKLKLPDGVTCDQCVLQWRYRTGNSWGTENGQSGVGLGQQEEFYGCSDIAINSSTGMTTVSTSSSSPPSSSSEPTSTTSTTTTSTTAWQPSSTSTTTTTTVLQPSTTKSTTSASTIRSIADNYHNLPGIECSTTPLSLLVFRSCDSFYVCAQKSQNPFVFACPDGTVFDRKIRMCNYDYLVPPPCGTCQHCATAPCITK